MAEWRLAAAAALATLALSWGVPAAGPEDKSAGPPRCQTGSLECVFCACFNQHADALKQATREVGALPNGVVILYRAEDPETIVHLQRYAFEKQRLRRQLQSDPAQVKLCQDCGALWDRLKGATFEVANSVHGAFTLITSTDPEAVRVLHKLASQETQKGVRGS